MKKLLMTILVAGALIGAVFGAAASLGVTGVDQLGANTVSVESPGVTTLTVTDIDWTLVTDDTSKVESAVLEITNSVDGSETCDVSATVYDNGATPIGDGTNSGETIKASSVDEGKTTVTVNLDDDPSAAAIVNVNVTIVCDV